MAALEGGDKAEAETLLGVLDADELVDMGERKDRWGSVGFAALELLMVRHSGMVADPLVTRIEGDAQWDWRQNLGALGQKITSLTSMLMVETDSLSEDQAKLIARANAMASNAPVVIMNDYDVENTRPMSTRHPSSNAARLGIYGRSG